MNPEEKTEKKISKNKTYEKTYKMRQVGGGIRMSIPKPVVKRKAKELGISIEEFLEKYRIIALFDDFQEIDIAYKFVKKKEED